MSQSPQAGYYLLGNPNIGKSSVFNHLTGLQQRVGNFAGVTIEKRTGTIRTPEGNLSLTDLPGTYSLIPHSPEESIVTTEVIGNRDGNAVFLLVMDAGNLARNLLLFSQAADLGLRCVAILTMSDVARKRGTVLDLDGLEQGLGCPVVPVHGRTGEGIPALLSRLPEAAVPRLTFFEPYCAGEPESAPVPSFVDWLRLASHRPGSGPPPFNLSPGFNIPLAVARETASRYRFVKAFLEPLQKNSPNAAEGLRGFRFDSLALHPAGGYLLMFLVLLLVFEGVFSFASWPMEQIELLMASASGYVATLLPEGLFRDFLTEGLLAGIQGVVVFIPQIAILFLLIGLLEQTGYMARVMVLLDRVMAALGMSGRAIVPLVSGVACAVPAILSTRTMRSTRERLIAIFVTPLMSCSARLPVFTLLIALLIPMERSWGVVSYPALALFGLYALGLAGAVASAWVLHRLLPGKSEAGFLIELPPYQIPNWKNLFFSVYHKARSFVTEAGKIILAISVFLWFLAGFGPGNSLLEAEEKAKKEASVLSLSESETRNRISSGRLEASYAGRAGQFIEPVLRPMGFDWKIGIALITSFAAREVFVGTISILYAAGEEAETGLLRTRMQNARNPLTGKPVFSAAVVLSLLVFYIFAMQCVSTLAVVYRETRSWKWPLAQLLYMTGLAFLFSTLTYQILN